MHIYIYIYMFSLDVHSLLIGSFLVVSDDHNACGILVILIKEQFLHLKPSSSW